MTGGLDAAARAAGVSLNNQFADMDDAEYWLITTRHRDCYAYSTRPIKKHPAEYMAKHIKDESLIYAMPITAEQYAALKKAYNLI